MLRHAKGVPIKATQYDRDFSDDRADFPQQNQNEI